MRQGTLPTTRKNFRRVRGTTWQRLCRADKSVARIPDYYPYTFYWHCSEKGEEEWERNRMLCGSYSIIMFFISSTSSAAAGWLPPSCCCCWLVATTICNETWFGCLAGWLAGCTQSERYGNLLRGICTCATHTLYTFNVEGTYALNTCFMCSASRQRV